MTASPLADHGRRKPATRPRLKIVVLYAQPVFWSMGEGCGAEIFTRLPAAIAARGHRVMVSLPALPGTTPGPGIDMYHGLELHAAPAPRSFVPNPRLPLPARVWDRYACWRAYQTWALKTARILCARESPDLVFGMGYFETPAAHRFSRELDVPCAVRFFGNNLSRYLHDPLRLYANFPEVLAFRTPADLIVLNDDGADGESVARRVGVRARRFVHMRNGLDYHLFQPGPPSPGVRRRLGMRPDQPLLLTATRLAPEKRLERAIEGLRGLLPRHRGATLALLGSGPEEARLKAVARERGVEERVLFPGPIPHRDLPDWYRSADIVLSLLDRTNASNPVFEAMACGRPVVALDAGTTREVVRDGETGVLLARSDLPALGRILTELIEDPALRERLGRGASASLPDLVMDMRQRLDYEVDLLEELVRTRREQAR